MERKKSKLILSCLFGERRKVQVTKFAFQDFIFCPVLLRTRTAHLLRLQHLAEAPTPNIAELVHSGGLVYDSQRGEALPFFQYFNESIFTNFNYYQNDGTSEAEWSSCSSLEPADSFSTTSMLVYAEIKSQSALDPLIHFCWRNRFRS